MKVIWKAIVREKRNPEILKVVSSSQAVSKKEFIVLLEKNYHVDSKLIKPDYVLNYILHYTEATRLDFENGISHLVNPGLISLVNKYNKLYNELFKMYNAITNLLDLDNYPLNDEEYYEDIFNVYNRLPDISLDNLVEWYAEQYHSEN